MQPETDTPCSLISNPVRFVPKKAPSRPLKIAILANEFFEPDYSKMGGFGWAARQVAQLFRQHPEYNVEVVFLDGKVRDRDPKRENLSGIPLIQRSEIEGSERLIKEGIDLVLTIDFRSNYSPILAALPTTPVIVWSRDPRTPADAARIALTRLPRKPDLVPDGCVSASADGLGPHLSQRVGLFKTRPVAIATPARDLFSKIPAAYGIKPIALTHLPNFIEIKPTCPEDDRPSVVFLGRLDPYKRPWLAVEVARRLPRVDFYFLGRSHFQGEATWEPKNPPANCHFLGHCDGAEKINRMSSSWLLLNTSIHEGLAVSFLEALKLESPIVAAVDTESVASRFGRFVGCFDGEGSDAVPKFVDAINALIDDLALRRELGRSGREWVEKTHNRERFLHTFHGLAAKMKVVRPISSNFRN